MEINFKKLGKAFIIGAGLMTMMVMAGCGTADNAKEDKAPQFTASNTYDGDLSDVTLNIGAASAKNAQGVVEAAGLADTPYKVEFHNLRGGNLVLEAIAAGQLDAGCGSQIPPISALDIALWDIKGKALGVPVYQLLGGKVRGRLRAYASQLQLGWGQKRVPKGPVEEYAAEARKAVAEGYDAVKVDVLGFDRQGKALPHLEGPLYHKYLALGEERVAAIREAVGPEVDIIIENQARTDLVSAIAFAKKMGYKTIGLGFCMGIREEARLFAKYFTDQGFEVKSVCCKNCGINKDVLKLKKVNPDSPCCKGGRDFLFPLFCLSDGNMQKIITPQGVCAALLEDYIMLPS